MSKLDRGQLDVVLANMFSNQIYNKTYLFYGHMIGQCSIVMRDNLPAAAGVAFHRDHYKLYINRARFDKFTVEEGLGVLKHEMLHIMGNHVMRIDDRVQLPWNYATDCAINQLIDRNHMPKVTQEHIDKYEMLRKMGKVDLSKPAPKIGDTTALYPDTFPVPVGTNWTSEQYYEALKQEADKQQQKQDEEQECSKCGGSGEMEDPNQKGSQKQDEKDGQDGQEGADSGSNEGNDEQEADGGETKEDPNGKPSNGKCTCDRCGGSGKEPGQGGFSGGTGELVDDHGTWQESKGDEEFKKALTKQMLEKSINETVKSRGDLPNNIEHYLELFTSRSQISWRRVLRSIVGKKKVNTRRTIMRSDRRFPKREDLKGKTKDRLFDLTVVVDVSGSMSDTEIMFGLNEIYHICKLTKITMKIIQVDTIVHAVEEFSEKTRVFGRSGCGGTRMEPAIDYIREAKIPTDACILITDGEIENVSQWEHPPRFKMMFLTTRGDIPGIESTGYQQFNLTLEA